MLLGMTLTMFAACGGAPRLADVPKLPVDVTGDWVLDRQASDDVRARMRPLIARKDRELNRFIERAEAAGAIDEPVSAPPPGTATGSPAARRDDASSVQWMRNQQRIEAEALIAWLSPASQLKIDKQGNEFRFLSDKGEGTRRFTPGETTAVFIAFGGFDVESGWDGGSFVVSSQGNGENRIRMLERYTVMEGGAAMEVLTQTRLPTFGKQTYRFIYRRR
jgi:hypothetical protein